MSSKKKHCSWSVLNPSASQWRWSKEYLDWSQQHVSDEGPFKIQPWTWSRLIIPVIGAQENIAIKIHSSELLGMIHFAKLVDSIAKSLVKSSCDISTAE